MGEQNTRQSLIRPKMNNEGRTAPDESADDAAHPAPFIVPVEDRLPNHLPPVLPGINFNRNWLKFNLLLCRIIPGIRSIPPTDEKGFCPHFFLLSRG